MGSLEPGKLADVVVTDGPLLEIESRVLRVFIGGREIDLADYRQTRFHEKYRDRLRRLQEQPGALR